MKTHDREGQGHQGWFKEEHCDGEIGESYWERSLVNLFEGTLRGQETEVHPPPPALSSHQWSVVLKKALGDL